MKRLSPALAALIGTAAFGHDGHGLTGAHGHASDTWGLLVLGVALALLLASRR